MDQKNQQQFNNSLDRELEIQKQIHKSDIPQYFRYNYINNLLYYPQFFLPLSQQLHQNLFKQKMPKNWFDDIPFLVGVDEIAQQEICSICLQDINENKLIKILQCNHYFHNDCLKEWVQKKAECPICRDNIHQQ